MKKIYCLGNPLLDKDRLVLKIMPNLRKRFPRFNFAYFDPTEGEIENQAIFIDTVVGIKKVRTFYDLKNFKFSPRNSVHDFDLPVFLALMLKMKKINSFMIIGVPEKYSIKKAAMEVGEIIKRI